MTETQTLVPEENTTPGGLQTIELTEPIWVGPWHDKFQGYWTRALLTVEEWSSQVVVVSASVASNMVLGWFFFVKPDNSDDLRGFEYESPEAAQQACEEAVVTWRNQRLQSHGSVLNV